MSKKKTTDSENTETMTVVFNQAWRSHLDADVFAISSRDVLQGIENETNPFWRFRGKRIVSSFDTGIEGVKIIEALDGEALFAALQREAGDVVLTKLEGFTSPE